MTAGLIFTDTVPGTKQKINTSVHYKWQNRGKIQHEILNDESK